MIEPFTVGESKEYYHNLQIQQQRGVSLQCHIADIHFGAMDPKTEFEILKEQYIDPIQPLKLDIISIDGDIFNRLMSGNSDVILYANLLMQLLIDKARRDDTTIVIISGTKQHDSGQLKIFYPYLNDTTVDVRIVEQIKFEYIKGMRILCIPELYGIQEYIYAQFLHYSGLYDMCFMHGTFHGAIYGDNAGEGRVFTIDDFTNCRGPIISGHVHTGGCFEKYFYYTGSPVRWSFGEEGEKGFLLVLYDMDTKYHYVHLQPIKSFRYDTVDIDNLILGDPKDIITYISQLHDSGVDYIRIHCTSELDKNNALNVLQQYYNTNPSIKFKIDHLKSIDTAKMNAETTELYDKFSYIFSKTMSPYDILSKYINDNQSDIIVSAKQIEDLVKME